MSDLFNTIRLIDLMDNTQNIESLYSKMSANLIELYDKNIYPVKDRYLFADFIERFCDRYANRYISFDTYGMFYIKLKFVLENNKKKYQRIYELSMKEIDPLITYKDNEQTKEDYTINNSDTSESTVKSDSTSNSSGENSTISEAESNGSNTLSFTDRKDKTETTPTGKDKTTTKSIVANTSNPKTYASVPNELSDLKYIDSEQLGENTQTTSFENRKDTTELTKSGSEKNTTSSTDKNDTTGKYNDERIDNSTSSSNTTGKNDSVKDGLIVRIREGFNGNQMELLKLYESLVFDLNNAIIEDISDAHLFMSTLC